MTRLLEQYLPPVNEDGLVTNKNATFGGNVAITGTLSTGGTVGNVLLPTTTTVLTAAQTGSTVLWNAAAGFTITLPAPNVGLSFTFGVATSVTSSNHKLITDAATTFLYGGLATLEASGSTNLMSLGNGSTHVAVTMNGTTTGGLIGTVFRVRCTSTTQWLIDGIVAGSGTLATPFATS